MARPLRIAYEGAFYHITSRGNERGKIFFTPTDYDKFKDYLKETQEKKEVSGLHSSQTDFFVKKGKREMIRKKILLILVSLVVVACALPCFADTVTYEYDNLYRLIKATYADGTVIEYTYDEAGNRLSVVRTPPAPTVEISADPATIQQGNSSTLSWTSTDATSCSIDQGIGAVDPNGSTSVSPTVTTMYTITATGDGGTAQDSVTVTVE